MDGMPVWLSTFIIGLGTVFIGLLALIFIIELMGRICRKLLKKKPEPELKPSGTENATAVSAETIENRSEVIAAVSAAIATVMGKDVDAIRIVSVKKVD